MFKLAKQQVSSDDDDSDEEGNDVPDDDSDSSNGSEDITEQVQQLGIEDEGLEEPNNPDEQDAGKIKIHE